MTDVQQDGAPIGRVSDDWCVDTELSPRFPIYTRFNANDVLPDPVTPLGADLVWSPHVLPGFTFGYAEMGAISTQEALSGGSAWPAAAFRYGHMYVNVTTARLSGIRSGLGWEVVDAAFFGNHPDAPPHDPHPDDDDPAIRARIAERAQWTLTTLTFPELEEDTRLADGLRRQRPVLAELSSTALVAYARSLMPYERMTWRGEVVGGAQAAVGPATMASVLPADLGLSPIDLVGPAGDVVSAEPSFVLWDLSRTVRSDARLGSAFDDGVEGLADRLAAVSPEFHQEFLAFLREYGYRGPSEWDVGADSWETRPELPLALVDRLRHVDDDQSPGHRREQAKAAADRAVSAVVERLAGDEAALATMRMGLASARRFAGWRELGKSNCIKVINEARVALVELGRRLVAAGHMTHHGQVFMALDRELDALALDPAVVMPVIRQREADWRRYAELEVPLFLDARVPRTPVDTLPRKAAGTWRMTVVGDVLSGVPASAGTATGRARIIDDPARVDAFEPGEVLVAPQTDPSWTPLFLVASAVVVGVGAPNSHAMIVSRELGIPCVAGVEAVTQRIPEGATLAVDGSAGTVTIVATLATRQQVRRHRVRDVSDPVSPAWLTNAAHRRWLESETDRLLEFGRRSVVPGGFARQQDDGAPQDGPLELWIACRMTHVYALGHLLGRPGCASIVDHGLAALRTTFADSQAGGWYAEVDRDGTPRDTVKAAYPHAFVILASSSAVAAGRPGAGSLLDAALAASTRWFWDDDAGMVVEQWDRDFSTLDPYRGVNANMHTVEAYLAAADVTGQDEWLDRALRITERVVDGFARTNEWRLPEHYDDTWTPVRDYNRDEPAHPFRPFGATIGHGFEWARLTLDLRAALTRRKRKPAGWMLSGAAQLFDAAVRDGWSVDGAPGFVYTVDWDGAPVVRERMHWVVAEAIAAAAALHAATGDARLDAPYRAWWDYVGDHLIDRANGSWHHELDASNRASATVWPGKADLYHAVQATLLPRLPLAPAIAPALAAGLLDS